MDKTMLMLATLALWVGCPAGQTANQQAPEPEPAAKQQTAPPAAASKESRVKPTKAPSKTSAPVTVVGFARRAKLAPMVERAEGGGIYCLNISEWPDHVLDRKVKVTGTLQNTDQFKARVDKSGGHSQGTRGNDTVMRDAKWELLKE